MRVLSPRGHGRGGPGLALLAFAGASPNIAGMADSVLTLIAAPAASEALAAAAADAARVLRRLGAEVEPVAWLAHGIACDVPFAELDPDQADAAARRALGALAIDVVAQSAAGRRKRLLLADMESTIIANEMLDEIAEFAGLRARVAEITRRAMNDELDFAAALRARVALLQGLPESVLADAGARIAITPGARALVATMRAHGARTALVSGGFGIFTRRIRDELGFDHDLANEIEIAGGRLAGTVREPIVTRDDKLAALKRLAGELGVPLAATLAVGDGANDLPMLGAAGLGIAYHAKPAVAARARARIDHTDLTALLYAQGYGGSEIVGDGEIAAA